MLLTVKVSCFEVEKPFVNLEIAKDNLDYKVVELVEEILNNNKNPHYSKNSKENEAFGIPDNKEQKAAEQQRAKQHDRHCLASS